MQRWFSAGIKNGTGSTDETPFDALASCYKNAHHCDTRRQFHHGSQRQFCEDSRVDTRFNQIFFSTEETRQFHRIGHEQEWWFGKKAQRIFCYYQSSYHPRPSIRRKSSITFKQRGNQNTECGTQHDTGAYCLAIAGLFTPLSRSTFLRLLQVCPASTWKSLQGIDYNSSVGA